MLRLGSMGASGIRIKLSSASEQIARERPHRLMTLWKREQAFQLHHLAGKHRLWSGRHTRHSSVT